MPTGSARWMPSVIHTAHNRRPQQTLSNTKFDKYLGTNLIHKRLVPRRRQPQRRGVNGASLPVFVLLGSMKAFCKQHCFV